MTMYVYNADTEQFEPVTPEEEEMWTRLIYANATSCIDAEHESIIDAVEDHYHSSSGI